MVTEAACHRCGHPVPSGARFCQNCGADVSAEQGLAPTSAVPAAGRYAPHEMILEMLREETLGEYEILGELGRGGMATVYLAHDIALDRQVAIKVMSSAILDEGLAERFRREARTAASLNHPHIIPIYSVRERYPLLFFVMKYIPGQSLDPVVKQSGPLPVPVVQTILSQAGSALAYAHRRGVIHRDVKPANIMIDDEGWVVVTDFGIAKVSSSTGLTITGIAVGTPAYMSPEQCLAQEVSGASDQYSLGVVAYELLAGQPAFRGDSAMAVMYAHLNDTPTPLLDLRPDCPPELAGAVMRMIEKNPASRWPSMDEAIAAVGAPPATQDTAARKQMIALAASGAQNRLTARLSVPTSPVPRRVATPARGTTPQEGGTPTTAPTLPLSATPPSSPPVVAEPADTAPPRREPVRAVPRPATAVPGPLPARRPWLPWLAGSAAVVAVAVMLVRLGGGGSGAREPQPVVSTPPQAVQPNADTGRVPPRATPPAADSQPPAVTAQPAPAPPPAPGVARIELGPGQVRLKPGETVPLSAVPRSADGSPIRGQAIRWSSSAPGVATVGAGGTVRGVKPGRATVTASLDGKTASVLVEVVAPAPPVDAAESVASVAVTPETASVPVGAVVRLSATVVGSRGTRLDRPVRWSASSSAAAVSQAGEVQGLAPGTAIITASSEGRAGTATVRVTPVPVTSLSVEPAAAQLKVGDSLRLVATPRDARGGALAERAVKWESSDPAVASVGGGLVVARGAGLATITASAEGRSGTSRITVTAPAPPARPDTVVDRAAAAAAVDRLVRSFAQAIESRDMAQVRRAYPGMSSGEEADWRALLEEPNLTRLQVALEDLSPARIEGTSAEAQFRLQLTLRFRGRPDSKQDLRYRASFDRSGGEWRLVRLTPR
ncbi:MAG TPA: protein kinase [Gemmatimonadales bacterium]|nr:protein kinase [Gemmatimonadales bacterium]